MIVYANSNNPQGHATVRLSDHGSPFYGGPNFKKNEYDPVLQQVGMTAERYRAVTTRADEEGRSSYVSVSAILHADTLITYRNCEPLTAWRALRPYWFKALGIFLIFAVRLLCVRIFYDV